METTITLEFFSDTRQHLEELERQLKLVHGVQVLLVLPKDESAPVLISLGISKRDRQAEQVIQRIAQTLYNSLHGPGGQSRKITLVTIEGESIDITALSADEIKRIVADAYANE